jgi:N-acetylglucosamine-6-sulfatase
MPICINRVTTKEQDLNKAILKPLFLLAVVLLIAAAGVFLRSKQIEASKNRPNIVFVYTDDLDMPLMPYMPHTNRLIGEQGAIFTHSFVTTSMCCPSRASTLRGQYPHNTGIVENAPGFKKFYRDGSEKDTIATWLKRVGYRNSLLGKYLNLYPLSAPQEYIPPGWDDWHVFIDEGQPFYFAYTMNENGNLVRQYKKPENYSTDVINRKAQDFIRESVEAGRPFFVFLSVYAPHGPSTPAPRHVDIFPDLDYPKKPSFHEEDMSDKPLAIIDLRRTGGLFEVDESDELFRKRVQSMQAVDEMVVDLVNLLEELGQLENTYIFFTSDNGFHMGEHMLPSGKMLPYEEDIFVPLYVRGPGIQPGTIIPELTVNIDLAPTFLELAGGKTSRFVDGVSLVPLLFPDGQPLEWRQAFLIGTGELEEETITLSWRGIRTQAFKFVEYKNGEIEFYDLIADPYEMENIASQLDPQTLATLYEWLEKFKTCKADECRRLELEVPDIRY